MTKHQNSTTPNTPPMQSPYLSPAPSKSMSPLHLASSHPSPMSTTFPNNSLNASTMSYVSSLDSGFLPSPTLFEDWLSTTSEMAKPIDSALFQEWISSDFPESDDTSSHTTLNSQTVSPILSSDVTSPMTVVGFDKVGGLGDLFGSPLFENIAGHADEMGELFPELAEGNGTRASNAFNVTGISSLDRLAGASTSITDNIINAISPSTVSLSIPIASPTASTSLVMPQPASSHTAAISRTLSSSSSSSSTSSSSFHIQPGLSPSVTIPWTVDENQMSEDLSGKAKLNTRLTKIAPNPGVYTLGTRMGVGVHKASGVVSLPSNNGIIQQNSMSRKPLVQNAPFSPSSPVSSTSAPISLPSRSRKRSSSEMQKSSDSLAEELAIKRAKNTDAARRSRLRKVMKMESLEVEVSQLKEKRNDLEKKIAVLESEKKNLEERSEEREQRVRELEKLLSEAHQRLIGKI